MQLKSHFVIIYAIIHFDPHGAMDNSCLDSCKNDWFGQVANMCWYVMLGFTTKRFPNMII
jgi:hypothetical protein